MSGGSYPKAPPPAPPPPEPTDPAILAAGAKNRATAKRRRGRTSTILAGDQPSPELATTVPAAGTAKERIGD